MSRTIPSVPAGWRLLWHCLASIGNLTLAGATALPALLSPMAFDAPGSFASPLTIALVAATTLLPVLAIGCAVGSWAVHISGRPRGAVLASLLPLAWMGLIALLILAIDALCAGQLGCR